jgi:hypothetical protein
MPAEFAKKKRRMKNIDAKFGNTNVSIRYP